MMPRHMESRETSEASGNGDDNDSNDKVEIDQLVVPSNSDTTRCSVFFFVLALLTPPLAPLSPLCSPAFRRWPRVRCASLTMIMDDTVSVSLTHKGQRTSWSRHKHKHSTDFANFDDQQSSIK